MELHPELFAVASAVDEVCSVVSSLANNKRIELQHGVSTGVGVVLLDRQKFVQVLYNLISNAVKFTDDGGKVVVAVEVRESQPHIERHLHVSVRDTGIGIRAADFGKLFVEFRQLDSGMARRYEGTGLGLALTRKIVEYQGGRISVVSEVGKGSTFEVSLPLAITPPTTAVLEVVEHE
jgi:protein-histidine pros-kinase